MPLISKIEAEVAVALWSLVLSYHSSCRLVLFRLERDPNFPVFRRYLNKSLVKVNQSNSCCLPALHICCWSPKILLLLEYLRLRITWQLMCLP